MNAMEFSLPLQVDTDSVLWKRWSHLRQRFQYYQSTSSSQDLHTSIVSVLLFAGRNEIDNMCASLQTYDVDFCKLNKILEIVESICLPNFLLLFERFQFFTLEPEVSETESGIVNRLKKQAEICQFGNLKESIVTGAATGWEPDHKCQQQIQNVTELSFQQSDRPLDKSSKDIKDGNVVKATSEAFLDEVCKREEPLKRKERKKKHVKERRTRGRKRKHTGRQAKRTKAQTYAKKAAIETRAEEVQKDGDDKSFIEVKISRNGRLSNSNSLTETSPGKQQSRKDKNLHCFLCSKTFSGVKWLQNHFLAHHPECNNFSCNFCDGSWENAVDYTNHFLFHFPELEHKRLKLKKAALAEKVSTELPCHLCSAKFTKEALLRAHMSDKHPSCKEFICAYCGKVYGDFSQYLRHNKRVHNLHAKTLTCDLCQAKFYQRKRLTIHLRKHLDLRQHQCEQCGKAYNERQMLVAHMRLHSSTKSHKCNVCGKNFLAISLLTKHMRSHTGEKPYTCELCGKSYSDISAFQYHQHWHAGEQPYACEICGKRTRSVGEKNKHKRVHSDKKPYVCECCGKAFRFISNLIEHRKGHSGKRVHICNVCGQSFIYRSGLTRHLQLRCPGNKTLQRKPRNSMAQHQALNSTFTNSHPRMENQNTAGPSQEEYFTWFPMPAFRMEENNSVVLVPQF